MKTLTIQQQDFKQGLHILEDDSMAPFGSARQMLNVIISDRGGISPRPGTALLGSYNSADFGVRGLYNFQKSKSNPDILTRAYDTYFEYFHPILESWALLKGGFTSDQEFGSSYSLVNTDNDDFMYFNNRYEEFQRWNGAYTELNGALTGGETALTVDSVLTTPIYLDEIATANSATTVDVSTANWAPNMYVGFFIHFPGSGKVRLITSNTINELTFNTLGGSPGNVEFQIRQLAFPSSSITATTIAFVAVSRTITDSASGFITAGFKIGDQIVVSGTVSNNKVFTITAIVAGTLTLGATDVVVDESAGSSFTIKLNNMKVIYNGHTTAYNLIDIATELPVSSAIATPDNSPVALSPQIFTAAPRGNRMDILQGRIYVGRVRSAISRNASGVTQGSVQAGSLFVSKLLNPDDFSFAATRLAGEGDILNVPYGGGDITDVKAFENEIATYKENYIELDSYTQDGNDTAVRTPLKTGIGSVARVIKGSDDHYFMRPDKVYTSLGRVRLKDITPQSENLAYSIKRLLNSYNNDNFNGIEFNNRIISCHKSSDDATSNDVMLVYNKKTKSFEGIWSLGANNFETFKGINDTADGLVYGESNGPNIWKMFQNRNSDIRDSDTIFPYTALWQSNFFNVVPLKSNIQAINSIAIEGYITANTTFTFNLYKNFETVPSLSFTFSGTETDFIQGTVDFGRFFGSHPFGTTPIAGTIGDPDENGRMRFSFIVYFPYIYGQYFSNEFSSSGIDQDWEIIRTAYGLKEDISTRTSNTKTI